MTMRVTFRIATGALAVMLYAAPMARGEAGKPAGTVIAVSEEVVKFKGADGKTYEVKAADVIAEDLKTGDIVEYEVIEGKPVKAKKKK